MKKFLTAFLLCFIFALSFSGCKENPSDVFEFGLLVDNKCSIESIKSKDVTSIEIPSTYEGRQVTQIGRNAFEGCQNLVNITIPEGIEKIESEAFKDCKAIENISLPNTIKEISGSAFSGCDSLNYNFYENGNYLGNENNPYVVLVKGVDRNALSFQVNENCIIIYGAAMDGFSKLASIDMPYSIKYIGANAFNSCSSLETFLVPNFVTHLDCSWFWQCTALKSITLSANIETVSIDYMWGCDSFTEFNVYSTNSKFSAKDGVLYSKDLKTLLAYPIAKAQSNFSIPSYVETIATYAFNGCIYLKSLTMWSTIKNLRSGAVINCKSLSTVHFNGTMSEWIELDNANLGWDNSFVVNKVYCSNGTINRSKA